MARPFAPSVLARARAIASQYRLLIAPEPGLGYLGRTLELPYSMGDGRTIAACAAAVFEATVVTLATMIENGEKPPMPADEDRRGEQVNIRLSKVEKLHLESLARQQGFRSVSDYVRAAALSRPA